MTFRERYEELKKIRGVQTNNATSTQTTATAATSSTGNSFRERYERLKAERGSPTNVNNALSVAVLQAQAQAKAEQEEAEKARLRAFDVNNAGNISAAQRAGYTLSGAAKQTVASHFDAASTLYQAGQKYRDTQNEALLNDYQRQYNDAERDYRFMIEDNEADPGTWSQGDIETALNRMSSAKAKIDAMGLVIDKNVQERAATIARDFNQQLSASGAKDTEKAKEGLGGVGRFAVDAATGLAQLGGDIAAGVATGGGATIPLVFRAFGGGTMHARQDGATLKEQLAYGGLTALAELLTERIGSVGNIQTKAFGRGGLDNIFEGVIAAAERAGKTKIGRMALNRLASAGAGFLSEGLEEAVAAAVEPIIAKYTYGKDLPDIKELAQSVAYDFLVGGAIGSITGGIGGANTTDAQWRTYDYAIDQRYASMADKGMFAADPMSKAGEKAGEIAKEQTRNQIRSDLKLASRQGGEIEPAQQEILKAASKYGQYGQEMFEAAAEMHGLSASELESVYRTPYEMGLRNEEADRSQMTPVQQQAYLAGRMDALETSDNNDQTSAVKNWTGYGDAGTKAFSDILETSGLDIAEARMAFQSPYEMGVTNTPVDEARMSDLQRAAYRAGQSDRQQMMQRSEEKAKSTYVWDEGLDTNSIPAEVGLTQQEINDAKYLFRALGVKGGFGKTGGNASITDKGVVTIAADFGISEEKLKALGNMSHLAKVKKLAKERGRSFISVLAHELAVHRTMQLAPTEFRAFMDAMYRHKGKDVPAAFGTKAMQKQTQYSRQGVSLSVDKAIEEYVADLIVGENGLYKTDAEFMAAVRKAIEGAKTAEEAAKIEKGARTWLDSIKAFLRKLGERIGLLKGAEKAQAQQLYDEVNHLKELFETALKAATDRVTAEREAETSKKSANETGRTDDSRGTMDYSMKEDDSYADGDRDTTDRRHAKARRNHQDTGAGRGIESAAVANSMSYADSQTAANRLTDTQRREAEEIIALALDKTEDGRALLNVRGVEQTIDDVMSVVLLNSEYDRFLTSAYPGLTIKDINHLRQIAKPAKKLVAKKNLTAEDEAYFAALKSDRVKAEQMVQKAAMRAGYRMLQFHFTDADFTVFKFGELGFHVGTLAQANYVGRGRDGKMLNLYIKADSPLYWPMDIGYWSAEEINRTMDPDDSFDDFDNAEEIRDKIREISQIEDEQVANAALREYLKTLGYDSIKYENTQDRDYGDPIDDSYILFDSQQLKSADVVTYDDDRNPIPLSQRFDAAQEDIRFSLKDSDGHDLTQEQAEYFKDSKVRDSKGNLKIMYHGTDADFTIFDRGKLKDGLGFFFTEDKREAADYGTPKGAYLNITKPFDMYGDTPIEDFLGGAPKYLDGHFNFSAVVKGLREAGYDGLYAYSHGTEWYVAFDSNQIKDIDNKTPTPDPDIRFSMKEADVDTAVNQSMTMQQAKDMVQRAFVLGEIKEWFEGEYKNGDEWLKGEGVDAVAIVIDNEWQLQEKYLNKIQGLMDDDFSTTDILDAYLAGTLTGKPTQDMRPKRLDVSGAVNAQDGRFYAPHQIENIKAAYETASQKVTNKNRDAVYKARADVVMFAHTRGAAEALGLTQAELNKKLSTWARYTARARETSQRFNAGVADWNKWTGIENSNILTRATVSNEDLDRLVGEITGDSDGFQRKYIMRTMLALDTHIDYTGLAFEFVRQPDSKRSSVNGIYSDSQRKIRVKYNAPNTVAHEMGHFLDYQWARDIGVSGALTDGFGRDKQTDPDVRQWLENFDKFKDSLTDGADLYSSYTMDAKEVFARFVDKFVRWVNFTANGEQQAGFTFDRNDKFTAQHYIEFVRLLQEKSLLDGKSQSNAQFSLKVETDMQQEIDQIREEGQRAGKSEAEIEADTQSAVVSPYRRSINMGDVIALEELRRENKKLQAQVERLKGQTKRTTTPTLRQGDVDKLARRLVKDYDSTLDWHDITEELKSLGEYMMRGGEELTWSEVKERAMDIGRKLVNSAQVLVDGELEQDLAGLKSYLRSVKLAYEDTGDIPDFNDWRKRHSGKFTISKDGLPVDVAWMELQSMFGELYFPADIINPTDQLLHITQLLDDMQSVMENPYSADMDQAIQHAANAVIDGLLSERVRQSAPTFADRQAAKLDAVKAKNRESTKRQLDRVRADRDAKIKALKDKHRAKTEEGRERQNAKELRRKIENHVAKLSQKLRKPSDNKHIPQKLRGAVSLLLEAIDLESSYEYVFGKDGSYHLVKRDTELVGEPTNRTKAAELLRDYYQKVALEEAVSFDPDLLGDDGNLAAVIGMRNLRLADMNSEQLSIVWKTIRAVEKSITEADKMLAKSKFKNVHALADAIRESSQSRKLKGNWRGIVGFSDKMLNIDMLDSLTFLHQFGDGGDALYNILQQARDDRTRILAKVVDYTSAATDGIDVRALQKERHTFTTERGDKVTLTTAQLMALYALNQREQARKHIFGGGIRPTATSTNVSDGKTAKEKLVSVLGKVDSPAESVRVTENDVKNMLSIISENQELVDVVNSLTGMMSGFLAEEGNKASMAVYGYEKFGEANYFPISSDPHHVQSKIGDMLDGQSRPKSVSQWGSAKQTDDKANNALMVGDIFDIVAQHSIDMATYASHLAAIEDIERVRNFVFRDDAGSKDGTMKDIIQKVTGVHGPQYLEKLLQDVSGSDMNGNSSASLADMMSNAKAAKVGMNWRVVLQQPTSYVRAAALIDPKYLTKAAVTKGGWDKALKYAPIARWKDWGSFEINQGPQLGKIMFGTDSKLDKARELSMALAGKADAMTWGALWNACELEMADTRPDLQKGTEEFYEAVAQRFTEVVDKTQVVDNVLGRSQIMRQKDMLHKMATSFLGEPTKQYNMLFRAYTDYSRETDVTKRAEAKKALRVTVATLTVTALVNAVAQAIPDASRDDDPEEKYWERFASHILPNFADNMNIAKTIPYVKDIISLLEGYDVKRMDTQLFADLISSCAGLYRAMNGEGRYTVPGSLLNVFASAADVFGLPASTIKRDAFGILRSISAELGDYEFQYNLAKVMTSVTSSSGRSELYAIMYAALNAGDVSAYRAMLRDMVRSGIKEDDISSAMRSRYRNRREKESGYHLTGAAKKAIGLK